MYFNTNDTRYFANVPLPKKIRLCELVEVDAGPQPMPEDVREAIIEVTNWVDDWTKDGDDGFDDLAAACHHIYRWLNAQPKGDG